MSTPSIRNIDSISTSTRRTRLIHFTSDQWHKAVAGIPVEDFIPSRHEKLYGLVAWQDPDQVIVFPFCGGPGERCQMRQSVGPGHSISFQCFCKPGGVGLNTPGTGGSSSRQPFAMRECFWSFSNGKLSCSGKCAGECRPVIVKQSFGGLSHLIIVCRCFK